MKIIANRFRLVFPNIISQEQASFIAGRNISDNVIIAQEVIHCMHNKKKSNNWMALKLDIEKAYDRVSWDFIRASLQLVGTPAFLTSVIMKAISSFTMQVLWNGIPSQKFKPARGIHQGCPLSHYMFVLCLEWLGRIIHTQIAKGKWWAICLFRSGLDLSTSFSLMIWWYFIELRWIKLIFFHVC